MSAVSNRIGDTIAVKAMIHLWSGPTNQRTTCGTIRPTKPMGPASAVAVPANRVTARTTATRIRPIFTPSEAASSSPSAKALSGRATTKAIRIPTAMSGANNSTMSRLRPPIAPTPQYRI